MIPEESVVPHHKLVVAEFRFLTHVQRDKRTNVTVPMLWKLKGDASRTFKERVVKEGLWKEEDG